MKALLQDSDGARQSQDAFTLVELLVSVSMLGLLAFGISVFTTNSIDASNKLIQSMSAVFLQDAFISGLDCFYTYDKNPICDGVNEIEIYDSRGMKMNKNPDGWTVSAKCSNTGILLTASKPGSSTKNLTPTPLCYDYQIRPVRVIKNGSVTEQAPAITCNPTVNYWFALPNPVVYRGEVTCDKGFVPVFAVGSCNQDSQIISSYLDDKLTFGMRRTWVLECCAESGTGPKPLTVSCIPE